MLYLALPRLLNKKRSHSTTPEPLLAPQWLSLASQLPSLPLDAAEREKKTTLSAQFSELNKKNSKWPQRSHLSKYLS